MESSFLKVFISQLKLLLHSHSHFFPQKKEAGHQKEMSLHYWTSLSLLKSADLGEGFPRAQTQDKCSLFPACRQVKSLQRFLSQECADLGCNHSVKDVLEVRYSGGIPGSMVSLYHKRQQLKVRNRAKFLWQNLLQVQEKLIHLNSKIERELDTIKKNK